MGLKVGLTELLEGSQLVPKGLERALRIRRVSGYSVVLGSIMTDGPVEGFRHGCMEFHDLIRS